MNEQAKANRLYVKDLQIGGIYVSRMHVSGQIHTAYYCYLGRTLEK